MSQPLLRAGFAALAATITVGATVVGVNALASDDDGNDPTYAKREDSAKEWVVSADDDGDDSDDDSGVGDSTGGNDRHTGRPSLVTRGSDQSNTGQSHTGAGRLLDGTHSNRSRGVGSDGSHHSHADDISFDASGGSGGDT